MKRFLMRSLTAQWVSLMLLALTVSQVMYFYIYRTEQARTVLELRRDEFIARATAVGRLVDTVDPSLHPEILRATNTGSVRFWLTTAPPKSPAEWQKSAAERLLESPRPPEKSDIPIEVDATWERLSEPSESRDARTCLMRLDKWNGFGLALPVDKKFWLNAVYAKPTGVSGPPPLYYISLAFTALLLTLVTALVARRVGRPLRRLTDAAERLGLGEELSPLPEEGADEIRRTAASFNRMQARLRRFVEDRTRMMAAISHDLRTPITILRLRAEFVEDEETRSKLIATLDEMKAMAEATLAFARDDSANEATRTIDLGALLGSLCADLCELGWQVEFPEAPRTPWRCRPESLRRALRNVIENAVRYGYRARVRIATNGGGLAIIIQDDGPGIAPADRQRVFDPFVRLEQSRNRSTGGVGLGLAIARSIIRRHGGDMEFLDEQDGFSVSISLPGSCGSPDGGIEGAGKPARN